MAKTEEIGYREALEWCSQFPETVKWLNALSPTTRRLYAKAMLRFHRLTDKAPDELLELAREGKRRGEPVAEHYLETVLDGSSLSDYARRAMANALKSFYAANYHELARKALGVDIPRKKPIRCPTQEEVKEFKRGMSVRDTAMIDFLACCPVREATLASLKWGHVWTELVEKPMSPAHVQLMGHELKGRGVRQYKDLEMHAFLHEDAVKSLLRYKRWREEVKGETVTPETPLFARVRRNAETGKHDRLALSTITEIFLQAKARTGLNFSPHDLRRFVQTQLEDARLQPNWIRKIMGKTVRGEEEPYSRPKIERLREAFNSAVPFLVLEPKPVDKTEQRKQNLLDAARLLLPPEKVAAIENMLAKARTTLEVEEGIQNITSMLQGEAPPTPAQKIEKIMGKNMKKPKPEDEDCQKIVSEEDLGNHLSHGWRVAAVLPSGRVVIEHNGAGPGPGSEA